jgi:hypothetical protein
MRSRRAKYAQRKVPCLQREEGGPMEEAVPLIIVILLIAFCVPICLKQTRRRQDDQQTRQPGCCDALLDDSVCCDFAPCATWCCSAPESRTQGDLDALPLCPCASSMPCCKLKMKRATIAAVILLSAGAGVIGWVVVSPQLMSLSRYVL